MDTQNPFITAEQSIIGENEVLIVLDIFYKDSFEEKKIVYDFKENTINSLPLTKSNLIKIMKTGNSILFLTSIEFEQLMNTIFEVYSFTEMNNSQRKVILKKDGIGEMVYFLIPKNGGPE